MSIKNHPGTPTEESTEAKRFADANSTTPFRSGEMPPTSDELIEDEVLDFLSKPYQSEYDPKGVARFLLGRINNRLISENTTNELKGLFRVECG